jgi:hypothetical protein
MCGRTHDKVPGSVVRSSVVRSSPAPFRLGEKSSTNFSYKKLQYLFGTPHPTCHEPAVCVCVRDNVVSCVAQLVLRHCCGDGRCT